MLKSKACEWIYINLTFRKMIGVMLFLHVVVSKGLIEMEMTFYLLFPVNALGSAMHMIISNSCKIRNCMWMDLFF